MSRLRSWLLLLGDLGLMYAALGLMLYVRGGGALLGQFWSIYLLPFTILNLVWVIVFFVFNLYSPYRLKSRTGFFRAFLQAMIVNGLLTVAFFYLLSDVFGISPKTNLALYTVIFIVLLVVWRTLIDRLLPFVLRTSVLFLQLDEQSIRMLAEFARQHHAAFHCAGLVQPDPISVPIGISIYHDLAYVDRLIEERHVEIVVVGNESYHQRHDELYRHLTNGLTVMDAASFWEEQQRKIPVHTVDSAWFLNSYRDVQKRELELLKRAFDLILSFGLILIGALPMLFVAGLIKLTSSGPVLYQQVRVGKNGKEFILKKFRTMVVNAEKDGAQWTQKDDPRVTAIGKILRHTHIDEFPQLFNVLKGEMSFVGPRPERPEMIVTLEQEIPFYNLRHLVKPGITGWAQINYSYGSSIEDAVHKLAYDLYYVKHRTFFLDLKIIFKTAAMLFRGEGR